MNSTKEEIRRALAEGVVLKFKDDHPEFQRIVLELIRLRNSNMTKTKAEWRKLYFFAEGAMVFLAFERFLRMILQSEASPRDTLPNLLEKATGARLNLIRLPGVRKDTIDFIVGTRNKLLHGNYEQAALEAGLSDKPQYFGSGKYIQDVDKTFRILYRVLKQINIIDGETAWKFDPKALAYVQSDEFNDIDTPTEEEKHPIDTGVEE